MPSIVLPAPLIGPRLGNKTRNPKILAAVNGINISLLFGCEEESGQYLPTVDPIAESSMLLASTIGNTS